MEMFSQFSIAKAHTELQKFNCLLQQKRELSERHDILPFIAKHRHFAALLGGLNPNLRKPDRLQIEYTVFGGLRADLAIGDSSRNAYTLLEFEDGRENSIFKQGRKYPAFSARFERGFSQLVDWLWKMNDQSASVDFPTEFGVAEPSICLGLVIGRSSSLATPRELSRFKFRSQKIVVNSRHVPCMTFDEIAKLCSPFDQ